jgi:hypothetical protein
VEVGDDDAVAVSAALNERGSGWAWTMKTCMAQA